jgi:hypothetical protein
MSLRRYTKGLELTHIETKKKVLFGAFGDDDIATCITKDTQFVKIPRTELDSDYITHGEMEKRAKERRRGQAW